MSFKRDENHTIQLGSLRKRRIADLFAEEIPEAEAFLCSNGRFSCLVCRHHPVFDTVHMLAIHRSGKKHTRCEEYRNRERENLSSLVRKRQHEEFLETGQITTFSAVSSREDCGFKNSPAHCSGAKRSNVKSHERKHVVTLNDVVFAETKTGSSKLEELPASKRCQENSSTSKQKCQIFDVVPQKTTKPRVDQDTLLAPVGSKLPQTFVHRKTAPKFKKNKKKKLKSVHNIPTSLDGEDKNRERFLQLCSSGWKKDTNGKWVKDEDVEFDSDQEEPHS